MMQLQDLTTFLSRPPILVLFATLALAAYMFNWYKAYVACGVGGFGQHPSGFVRCICVKFILWINGVDFLDTTGLDEVIRRDGLEATGWLQDGDVPLRRGEREKICPYPMPQRHWVRERNEPLAKEQYTFFKSLPASYRGKIQYGMSHIERTGPGIFAHDDVPAYNHLTLSRREIAHIHVAPFSFCCSHPPPDGLPHSAFTTGVITPYEHLNMPEAPQSLHILLSAKDAKLVIERGWGARHAAGGTPPWPLKGMPHGFTFVYAPRDWEEEMVVRKILKAGVEFSTWEQHANKL
ncbi:hypothetical protein T439DRAFT_352316 [Meredithblackwellia eburnea MCA 4105]